MATLNLTATNRQEEIIKQYLEENANEALTEKINNGIKTEKDGKQLISKKNLTGFFKYATEEARKLAEKGANSAMVEEQIVYGWAMHYFEEDSILGTLYNEDGTEYKPIIKKASKPITTTSPATTSSAPPIKKTEPQISFFDLISTPKEETKPEPKPVIEKPIQEEKPISPIYKKYMDAQTQYPDAIIAYRLGDFYEVFGDGAIKISDELDLTLTGRDFGLKERVPMVGFPYHCAEKYFKKITELAKLIVIDNKEISIYDKISNDYKVDMETGEIITEETENEIITSLKTLFGNKLEILL